MCISMTVIRCMVSEIKTNGDKNFYHFTQFFAFYPTNYSENKNCQKMKKMSGDIIISHMCTINDNHMMYLSWDMEHEGHKFLSF